jgi:4'-phosphopantetheinyl transferase
MTGDVVEVWLIRTDLPGHVLADLLSFLDDGERERARALAYPDSRRRFIAAHGAFRVILGRHLGVPPASLRWHLGPHGKPELAMPGPRVSFSHSGDFAALATAPGRRVGVDIQQLLPRLDVTRLAARFYPRQEAEFVASAVVPARQVARFTRLWARKEAYVKVAGGRLLPGLEQVIPPSGVVADGVGGSDGPPAGPCLVRDVRAPRGYRAAVAAEGTHAYDVIRRWAILLSDGSEIYMAMLICIADMRLIRATPGRNQSPKRLRGRSIELAAIRRLDNPVMHI